MPSSRTVVSWPAANRLAAMRTTSMTSGVEPSGNVAVARPGQHVVARLAPAVLDVVGELLVEELERAVRQRVVAGAADRAGRLLAVPSSLAERRRGRLSGTPSRSAMTSMRERARRTR